MLHSDGLVKTPTSAKTAAATLTDGYKSMSAIATALGAATGGVAGQDGDVSLVIPLGPTGQGLRRRGVTLYVATTEADGASLSLKPRLLYGGPTFNPRDMSDAAIVRLLGTATLTVGSGTGVSGDELVTDAERLVDTITWSGSAFATKLELLRETQSISNLLHSPADNTAAALHIPDCDDAAALLVEIVNANASKATRVIANVWT